MFDQEFRPDGRKEFVSKSGVRFSVTKEQVEGVDVYRLNNSDLSNRRAVLYIHGGPNLSCVPYIEDTIQGSFRSLENILRCSHILLVEQKSNMAICTDDSGSDEIYSKVLLQFGPEYQARVYFNVIKTVIDEAPFGVFAQSFGMQILFYLLNLLPSSNSNLQYLALGSPFFGVKRSRDFIHDRRFRLNKRGEEIASCFSSAYAQVKNRLDSLHMEPIYWHKLALDLAHPAYSPGIIYKELDSRTRQLLTASDAEFRQFFELPPVDIINFCIGSKYFTPGSNLYRETTNGITAIEGSSYLPDEGKWLQYVWRKQYPSSLLAITSDNYSFYDNVASLASFMKDVPCYSFFDRRDIAIPVDLYFENVLPQIDGISKIYMRDGYGHWAGHSLFYKVEER